MEFVTTQKMHTVNYLTYRSNSVRSQNIFSQVGHACRNPR